MTTTTNTKYEIGYLLLLNPIRHQRARLKSPRITKINATICAGDAITKLYTAREFKGNESYYITYKMSLTKFYQFLNAQLQIKVM